MSNSVWQPCPRCDSKKVQPLGKAFYILVGLLCFSLFFWVGFIFPPLWLGCLVGLVFVVIGPFMPKQLQCKECKHIWKPTDASKSVK